MSAKALTSKAVFSLAYVLISSYLIAHLGIDWWLTGAWELNLGFAVKFLAVCLLQLVVLTVYLSLSPASTKQPGVKRLLLLWLCLFIAYVAATALVSVFLLRHLDLRYIRYFQIMAIPLLQSLVLIWVITPDRVRFSGQAARQIADHPGIVGLLLVGLAFPLAALGFPKHDYLGILGAQSILPAWTGLLLAAAGLFTLLLRRHESFRSAEKIWMAIYSFLSLALAAEIVFPWIDRIPYIAQSTGLQLMQAKFTPLLIYIVSLAVLVKIGHLLRKECKGTGLLFDIAVITIFLVGNIVFLDLYQPYPTPFAQTITRVGIAIASCCILVGVLLKIQTQKVSNKDTLLSHS